MAEFDMDAYLRRRPFNPNGTDRLQGLEEASQAKIKALSQYSAERQAQKKANESSLVNQLGLESDSISGQAVNLAASFASGASRVGGQLAALPVNALAIADEISLDGADHEAYNRYVSGKASQEDLARLHSKKAMYSPNDRPEDIARAQELANKSPDAPTVMQLFDRAQAGREAGQGIAKSFDLSGLVNNEKRAVMQKQLEGNFDGNWERVKQGWEALKKGEDAAGWGDMAAGIGKLIYNAGEAAVENPAAASEYIVENIPQLGMGLLGAVGKAGLTASNVGYGADLYQQGIEKYRKANNGELPSVEERQHMAMNAAGAVLAEQGGDLASLALMKAAGKASTDAVRTGFKESLKNSIKATAGGVASEGATEGAQTYMEGEATLKPASAKDIYVGATIGGIAGGGLSGGGRAVAELAQATPEFAAKRAKEEADTATFVEHARTGNADAYLDEKSQSYNPSKAVAVLFAHSQSADATPEIKQQNIEKAHDIVAGLETQRGELQAQLDQMTPEGLQSRIDGLKARIDTAPDALASRIQEMVTSLEGELASFDPKSVDQKAVKSLKTQMTSMDRQIAESTKLRDQLAVETKPDEAGITAAVEQADAAVDATQPEAAKNAVAHVVSLAMAHPDSFSDEHLNRLVQNQNNSLSPEQRTYLRTLSESRIAENAMKNLGIVENEVMNGDAAKNQLGIKDYKQRMQAALNSRNDEQASSAVHMIGKFANAHKQKLRFFMEQFSRVGKSGAVNVVPSEQGWKLAPTQDVSPEGQAANRKVGGMTISPKSVKLIRQIQAESKALDASRSQLQAAYALRFNTQQQGVPPVAQTSVKQSGATQPVDSSVPTEAQGTAHQPTAVDKPVTTQSTQGQNQSNVDSTVNTAPAATKAADRSFRKAVNQEAKEKGIKQARGKRTLDDVLADLAVWEQKQSELEAEEERIAIQAESAFFEGNAADIMQELAEVAGYTNEEIESVRNEDRKSEERPVEAAEGTSEEGSGDRANAGQAEEGKGPDGESGKLSVFEQTVDLAGQKFGEAFKSINLIAYNLVQKAGKGKATQRPLVAVKDFLTQWQSGSLDRETVERFIGEPMSNVQEAFLEQFRVTAGKWIKPITKNLVKGQVTAGVKYKQAIKAANALPSGKRAAALAQVEKDFQGKKPGDVQYEEWKRFTNPIQFLIEQDASGQANTEENIKTAIAVAAFMYVAENAKAPQVTSLESVKDMFGVGEYDVIGDALYDRVSRLGSPERAVIISMGQRATQALGLSAKKGATQDFLARLDADLGAHVMKLLVDRGVIERTVVNRVEISAGLKHLEKHDASKQGDMAFLRMVRSEGRMARDRKLNPVAERISTMAKGTHSVLGKLFGVEDQVKLPSWEPIKVSQSTTANTDQEVPDFQKKIIQHENSVANFVRGDVWTLLQGLGEEAFLEMAGYIHPDEATMHKFSITAAEVSNEALRRELSAAQDYFGSLEESEEKGGSPLGLKQPLYLNHSVWKQQRVGIDGAINPQSSKIHRWMLTRADWQTTVSSTDQAMMDSFMLRVGEGLGVKTDKQGNAASLPAIAEMFNTQSADAKTADKAKVLRAAVDALIRSRQPGAEMLVEDRAAILAGVAKGGEKMHSMDALIAMANYQEAKTKVGDQAFTFDVQLMGEVDGVTNGPMLSHLALGAGTSADALMQRLNKGGFFQDGAGFSNYNVWRGTATHTDLYESTIAAVIKHINGQADKAATFDRLQKITGTLSNKDTGSVEKAGRNIIKTPLTAMLFGSTVDGAVDSMFRDFIAKSYEGLEKIAELKEGQQAALDAYVDNLNALLKEAKIVTERIPYGSGETFLTEFEFSDSQEKALEEVFKDNLGESVKETMKDEFASFLDVRDVLNSTANATFGMYHAAYQGVRQSVINELIAAGDIAVGKDGKPLHDLTTDQEKLIDDRVAALSPEVQTFLSKQSKNAQGAGLHISKSSRQLSQEKAYQNVSQFGHGFPVTEGPSALSMRNSAYQRILAMPGVAMVPMMIHSLDSAISHLALMGRQVLNVHDAHGTGLKGFIETAQALNKSTWESVLGYSPAAEMRDAFRNTLLGMDALLKSGENKEAILAEMKQYLSALGDKYGSWVDGKKIPMDPELVLVKVASQMFYAADKADRTKYEAMSQLRHVDQYALEGGQYDVTDKDRAKAAKLLEEVGGGSVPGSVWSAIDRINEAVLGIKQAPISSPYGFLGESSVASNAVLTRSFEDQEIRTAEDVIKQIEGMVSPANKVLLKKIKGLIDPKMPVQMVTARTKDGATLSKEANARGWFAYKGAVASIYVLSPEFKLSGLTPELLVHELLHAALAKTIEKPNTPEAKALVASLEQLKNLVVAHLDATPELKQKYPMELNVHELVSWGMSDLGFQTEVLTQIPAGKSSVANKAMSVMVAFIKAVSKFLGLPMTVKNAAGQEVDNALAALIQDVSGLFEQAKNPDNGVATDTFSATMQAIDHMTTQDVFEALDEGKVTPTFSEHLQGLLSGIANKLHGPYGTFKALVESQIATTPKDLWKQAKGQNKAPFGSAALAAGIPMNDQVAFVLEQVEASVQGALEANTGTAHDVYVELAKLYQEAKAKLENNSTLSQDIRDFLFKMDMGQGGRTRHLARFAAMGLAHPDVNAALKIGTDRAPIAVSGSFAHRLEALFQKVLEWFNGRLTHTFAGQDADAKLKALVAQLVEIEARRKEPLIQKASALDFIENSLKQGSANLKNKVDQFGKSDWLRTRKSNIVRASGAALSMVAGERTESVLNHIQAIRDRQINQGFGLAMGLVNEVRGTNNGNVIFHRLIRESKLREGIREDLIVHTGNVALESFANKGMDLTQKDKAAITAGLLRTDIAALLDHHSMDEIYQILGSEAALDKEITRLEGALAPYRKVRGYYERYAKNLGFKLAAGKIKGLNTMMNATNIAKLTGTGMESLVSTADASVVTPIIDQLASLYAFRYTKAEHKAALAALLKTEAARGNESGVEMVIKLHKSLQEQSKERLFEGTESLMMKGYTPEIYDPKKEVVVATEQKGAELEAQGFIKGKRVSTDPTDPDKADRFVYKRDGGGLRPWLSGIVSYTGEAAKGSRSKSDNVQNLTEWKANKQDLRRMRADKKALMQQEFRYDPNYDPSKVEDNFAAPVVNPQGDVVDYRYLMAEDNKDDLLNRDSRFDKVLGSFAGSIYDKESTKESNRKAVQALHDQYQADFALRSESYRKVGPDSADAELADIYRMLPEDTKQAIRDIWGSEHMMVRSDLMDINFGYRKVSVTDAFHKEQKNVADQLFTGLFNHVWGEKAEYNLRRVEDVWQEIVAETKEILVIKNLSTLIGNIGSNISLLFWQGVPLKDMARYHRIALKGVSTYRADSAALIELETKLAAGVITTSRSEMQREIRRLQDSLESNPVKELIDAGLMPSIVEDVSPDDDLYSYKSRLTHYVDGHTNKLNKHVLGVAKVVYMAKDTKMYQALHHATQLSDFVARYALYAHVTSRKQNPLGKEDAIQLASDSFVNYDLPSHRKLQYMNDMGFVRFTKYYLRIQKVIARLYADNPGRAMAILATDAFFANAPALTDSGFSHHLGNNPFELGALNYPGVLDELVTIKMGAAVIR